MHQFWRHQVTVGVQAAQDVVLWISVTQTAQQIKDIWPQQWLAPGKDYLVGPQRDHFRPQASKLFGGYLVQQRPVGREVAVYAAQVAHFGHVQKDISQGNRPGGSGLWLRPGKSRHFHFTPRLPSRR
jgi:hypothetical protein